MAKSGTGDKEFLDLVEYCKNLRSENANRVEIQKGMEDIFLMRDTDADLRLKALGDTVALVKDPSDRNSITGGRRLLSAAEEIINVKRDVNSPEMVSISETIERAAYALIAASDKFSRKPLRADVSLSNLLYDECHIQVVSTADMVDWAAGANKAAEMRMKRLNGLTPYIFKVGNPRSGYPVFDDGGLVGYHRYATASVGSLLDAYGEKAKKVLEGEDSKFKAVYVCEYWDGVWHVVWVDGEKDYLLKVEHRLPFIPIAAGLSEGSALFDSPEDQREPILYTEYQSGMYKRRNELNTALATNLREIGLTPLYVYKHADVGVERPRIEHEGFLSFIDVGTGDMVPMRDKGIVDPAFEVFLNMLEKRQEESTFYKTTLGQPMSNAPFSLQAMLANLGRLPLETVRLMSGRVIADALEIAFLWWKEDGGTKNLFDPKKGIQIDLDGKDIADTLTLDVKLDIALPQDMLQMASVFNALDNKVPRRWLYEEILKVGKSDEFMKELVQEQMLMARTGQMIQNKLAMIQMQEMPPMPQMQAPGGQEMQMLQAMGNDQSPEAVGGEMGVPSVMTEQGGMGPEMSMPLEELNGGVRGSIQ